AVGVGQDVAADWACGAVSAGRATSSTLTASAPVLVASPDAECSMRAPFRGSMTASVAAWARSDRATAARKNQWESGGRVVTAVRRPSSSGRLGARTWLSLRASIRSRRSAHALHLADHGKRIARGPGADARPKVQPVLQRVLVEHLDEGGERVVKQAVDRCGRANGAFDFGAAEAVGLDARRLHHADDLADADLGGRLG